MKPIRTRTARAIAVAIVAGSLALTGCSGNDNGGGKGKSDAKSQKDAAEQQDPVAYGDAAASTGPAEEVPRSQVRRFHQRLHAVGTCPTWTRLRSTSATPGSSPTWSTAA
ncbi:hypothetical protein GCM10019016_083380 [Streptomyces prasinosporus]|uniref:Uncharacterized protein n=1 Tax=Streptomyces prasinosporus TaxID=68256 RepID=A0ABP6U0Q3_9ACTN